MVRPILGLVPFLTLAACGGGLRDETFATGSRTMALDSARTHAWTVNVEEGTVSILDLATDAVTSVSVGGEPSRIAPIEAGMVVSLRSERAVVVLDEAGGQVRRLHVGAEPVGVVSSEDGKRFWVAVSQDDRVLEFDAVTLEELRAFDVLDQPEWLALHPSGRALFVASPSVRSVQRIDLRAGTVSDVELPGTERLPTETLPGGETDAGLPVDLTPRVTGDPAILPDGSALGLPVHYVDDTSEVTATDRDVPEVGGGGYGSSSDLSVSRMNPAIVSIPLDRHGEPEGEGEAIFAGAFGMESTVRSFLSSVTADPDGNAWLAPMEGSGHVVAVSTRPSGGDETDATFTLMADTGGKGVVVTTLAEGGFAVHGRSTVMVEFGPRSVAFVDGSTALVHHWGERSVGTLDAAPLISDAQDGFQAVHVLDRSIVVEQSGLATDLEFGRRLFASATDERMAGTGAGVSCATCHFEGRNDGLTWPLENGGRQTPSLVGGVSATAPMTWSDDVASVAAEARLTSEGRMGGQGLTHAESDAIGAWVETFRAVDNPAAESPEVTLGAEIFARPEVGCATCHSGERYTDNGSASILGGTPMNTPSLTGAFATAPYFHDGSAATLRDVLEFSRSGLMGDTSALTDAEMDALEAFLLSL
jgi:mono/diheme cytochrome c family protein